MEIFAPWFLCVFFVLVLLSALAERFSVSRMREFLADPGKARGCSTNSLVIHWLIHYLTLLSPTALRRRHSQTVRDRSSSYKIVIKNFLNPKEHQNCILGSKAMAILLKGWILPIGGASAGEGLRSTGLPLLVFLASISYKVCLQLWSKYRFLGSPAFTFYLFQHWVSTHLVYHRVYWETPLHSNWQGLAKWGLNPPNGLTK